MFAGLEDEPSKRREEILVFFSAEAVPRERVRREGVTATPAEKKKDG